jgi:hypothetical protein
MAAKGERGCILRAEPNKTTKKMKLANIILLSFSPVSLLNTAPTASKKNINKNIPAEIGKNHKDIIAARYAPIL